MLYSRIVSVNLQNYLSRDSYFLLLLIVLPTMTTKNCWKQAYFNPKYKDSLVFNKLLFPICIVLFRIINHYFNIDSD